MPFVSQLAIVSDTPQLAFSEVAQVTAALQKQVSRDVAPLWSVDGTVACFATLEEVPQGYWPIIVRDDIGFESAGVHCDKNGQPIALVTSGPDWAFTASHEAIEILVDPYGRRMIAGSSPDPAQGRVEFLVEVSDPVSSSDYGYTVNGIRVTDFVTPQYFDPDATSGARYSFCGHATRPREVFRGGYLTWHDPISDEWWQQSWFDGDAPTIRSLGKIEDVLCGLRSAVDAITARHRETVRRAAGPPQVTRARRARQPKDPAAAVSASAQAKAAMLRKRCEQIIAKTVGDAKRGRAR